MCHKLDARFFQQLSAMKPAEVCRRTLAQWNGEKGCYRLTAWGGEYEVDPKPGEIRPGSAGTRAVSNESGLTIIFYLLGGQDLPLTGEWISEKDIPGGEGFFRGPHAVPSHLITDRFGEDVEGFRAVCARLGGKPLDMADAAYVFRILPRVPAAVLLWRGDEEFPAEAKLLFDRMIGAHLPLDCVFALAGELCERIGRG
jgi:hypothetical protein